MKRVLPLAAVIAVFSCHLLAQFTEDIRVNQEGYFHFTEKIISVKTNMAGTFKLKSPDLATTYLSGTFAAPKYWVYSDENIATIDLSSFNDYGEYVIEVQGLGYSHPFTISRTAGINTLRTTLKGYYYMRASTPIEAQYADIWARDAGHPDTDAKIHASAATANYPEGSSYHSPGGWYDAGDYGKYIVNCGLSTYTLLATYEHYPTLLDNLSTNIPESNNNVPDILDEAKWNLDWMLTMQDTFDGGVFSKLSNATFDGKVLPANRQNNPRYVVKKTEAAALNFAIVMAVAARVYKPYYPDFATECLDAAKDAHTWAKANVGVYYNQQEHNNTYNPDIFTGEYNVQNPSIERIWALVELYISTKDDSYYNQVNWNTSGNLAIPSWINAGFAPIYSLLHHKKGLSATALKDTATWKNWLKTEADAIMNSYYASAHRVTMGHNAADFIWGSNAIGVNQGMLLVNAFRHLGNFAHRNAAIAAWDYVLGRNPTGYCYVTGLGDKPSTGPHHRPSAADGVDAPNPGFLVGGAQNGLNPDDCEWFGDKPATKYHDGWCSYSTNEIAINWNAPLVYLSAALQNDFMFGDYTGLNPRPSAPKNLKAEGKSNSSIALSWEDISKDEHNYAITRSDSAWSNYFLLSTPSTNSTSYLEENLIEDSTYYYDVQSQNFNGYSDPANTIAVRILPTDTLENGADYTYPDGKSENNLTTSSVYTSKLQGAGVDSFVVSPVFVKKINGIQKIVSLDAKLYPNPSQGIFNVSLDKAYPTIYVSILDLQGREVLAPKKYSGKQEIEIKTDLSQGNYFLAIRTDNQRVILNLLIVK